MNLDFHLHPAQSEIYLCPARFVVCAAGRRFGKTYLARVKLVTEALRDELNGVDLCKGDINVAYVAPTHKMSRQIMWGPLMNLLAPMKPSANEQEGVIRLVNGRKIYFFGADSPDNMRGGSFSYLVLDEYAQMKPDTWSSILRPSLNDCAGGAVFIGTPAGKNHFFKLFTDAIENGRDEWEAFTFTSYENPFIRDTEIEAASLDMPSDIAAQEFRASFTAGDGSCLKDEWIKESDAPPEPRGDIFMAVDLSGFDERKRSHGKSLDDTAIAIVEAGTWGWYVHDIVTGRWDVRETAIRILRLAQNHRPVVIGIEKGPLKNAIHPYLTDNMKRIGVFPPVAEVTHGNKAKTGRITWSLQGRLEQGRLLFKPGAYLAKFRQQAADFPNPYAHDDMLDALAFIDQVAHTNYYEDQAVKDDFEPLDAVAGY
jgi:hypothetical protein